MSEQEGPGNCNCPATAQASAHEHYQSCPQYAALTDELPAVIRAFGGECTRTTYEGNPTWLGRARDGSTVVIAKEEEGWRATAVIGGIEFTPHLHSASSAAAIRNLRGLLHNTQISLTKMLLLKGHA